MKARYNHYRAPRLPHNDSPRLLLVGLIVGAVLAALVAILLEHAA